MLNEASTLSMVHRAIGGDMIVTIAPLTGNFDTVHFERANFNNDLI